MLSKPDFTLKCADINDKHVQKQFIRDSNPLEPKYKLPSYVEAEPYIPPGTAVSFVNKVSDIPGATYRGPYYNSNLKREPAIRQREFDVSDITNGMRHYNQQCVHVRGPEMQQLYTKDISSPTRTFKDIGRHTDPMQPVYQWKNAETFGETHIQHKDKNFKLHMGQLRTDDIIGLDKDLAQRLHKYGYVRSVRDQTYIGDISGKDAQRPHLQRNEDFNME